MHKGARNSPRKNTVAIIGLGLMGGSLGMALKRRGATALVRGYARRAETRRLALTRHAADEVFDSPEAAAKTADIVVFCAPVLSTLPLIRACIPALKPGAMLTDVGSTKARLASMTAPLPVSFIGSHPIAGSEQTGIESARADLYEDAVVVLTPVPGAHPGQVRQLARFWKSVGSRIVVMPPAKHDALLARTSHLPHLLAATLVEHVCGAGPGVQDLCGGGFRDVTRIAKGSPEMWRDIVATNRGAILRELRGYRRALAATERVVALKDLPALLRFLERTRRQRQGFD